MILAGDIGGTNTRLALVEATPGPRAAKLRIRVRGEAKNADHGGLAEIAAAFLRQSPRVRPQAACFGVAGPVENGRVTLTNLNWELDCRDLQRRLHIPRVGLVNDLVAHAEGTNVLEPDGFELINPGEPSPRGNRAIIAAGTGLGEGVLAYEPALRGYRAIASEGGHGDFGPRDEREDALLVYLRRRLGWAPDWESVLSGPGLRNLYDFLIAPGPHRVTGALPMTNPKPEQITAAGIDRSCPACTAAVGMFVSLYGAEAGNLALKVLARGGMFIGGGIAPHLRRLLRRREFRRAFAAHGPPSIQRMLRTIPIRLIISDHSALLGAALYAKRMLEA